MNSIKNYYLTLKTILVICIMSVACKNDNKNHEIIASVKSVTKKTVNTTSLDTLRDPHHLEYLTDLPTYKIAQLILQDSIMPIDNTVTFRCIDSVLSNQYDTSQYYLPAFCKIIDKSDGALSEAVSLYVLNFIKRYPKVFIQLYAENKNNLNDKWEGFTVFELIAGDENFTIKQFIHSILKDCKSCNEKDRLVFQKFEKNLEENIKEFKH